MNTLKSMNPIDSKKLPPFNKSMNTVESMNPIDSKKLSFKHKYFQIQT